MKTFKTNALVIIILISLQIPANSQTFIDENFNNGIPINWSKTIPTCGNSSGDSIKWIGTTNGWRGQGMSYSLDSTEFVIIDSELPAVYCVANEYLYSNVFDASAVSTLTLEFDQYFRFWLNGIGVVEVYNGSSWIPVATFTGGNYGTWLNPDHQTIDLSPFINANMQIRFYYTGNWDWYWAIDNVKIYAPSAFSINITSTDPLCNGDCDGTATATPNGGLSPYNYQWDDNNNQTTQTATGLCDGTYHVTVVDNNGDSVVSTVDIVEPAPITTVDSTLDILCNGNSTGFVFLIAYGGTTPYSYNWSTGATTAFVSNLPAGTYTVSITDNNACTKVDTMTINEPAPIILSISSTDDNGNCDGSATVNVSGGTTPYLYIWDSNANFQTTQTADSLCTGNYCVSITDANGCTKDTCVQVDLFTGIAMNGDKYDLIAYPNPAGDILNIVGRNFEDGGGHLILSDIFGRVVLLQDVMIKQGRLQKVIETKTIMPGIYLMHLKTNKSEFCIRVVIQ